MFNNKKYYKENKTSDKTKSKIEKDTLTRNIKDFSVDDIARTTTFERKARQDNVKKNKATIPTYNTTRTMKSKLSAYGTYLDKNDDDKKSNEKNTKQKRKKTNVSRFNKKTTSSKMDTTVSTISDYITQKELQRRQEVVKEAIKKEKDLSSAKKRERPLKKIRKNKEDRRERINEDTIDLLLSKLPVD